jgi:hypothetical protein
MDTPHSVEVLCALSRSLSLARTHKHIYGYMHVCIYPSMEYMHIWICASLLGCFAFSLIHLACGEKILKQYRAQV